MTMRWYLILLPQCIERRIKESSKNGCHGQQQGEVAYTQKNNSHELKERKEMNSISPAVIVNSKGSTILIFIYYNGSRIY